MIRVTDLLPIYQHKEKFHSQFFLLATFSRSLGQLLFDKIKPNLTGQQQSDNAAAPPSPFLPAAALPLLLFSKITQIRIPHV